MRHIYRVHYHCGATLDKYSKKELIDFLAATGKDNIKKVTWYKSNGFWVDVTASYM